MVMVRLLTNDKRLVCDIRIPPFLKLPEGLVWGSRTFFYSADESVPALPAYVEGLLFFATPELPWEREEAARNAGSSR